VNTAEVNKALARHYGQDSSNVRTREEWILIFEARNAASFDGGTRTCDLIAINTWTSRGLMVHGHEVKVSRNDWVKEMNTPEKAHLFWKHCHRWWLVVPAPWRSIVKVGELPEGWGLKEVLENGKVRTVTQASPIRERTEPSWSMIVAWFAGLDRKDKRDIQQQLLAAKAEGVQQGRAQMEGEMRSGRIERAQEVVQEGLARIREFETITGISVNGWRGLDEQRMRQIKAVWELVSGNTRGPGRAYESLVGSVNTLAGVHQTLVDLATFVREFADETYDPPIKPLSGKLDNAIAGD
jgi:hypothetical protein